MAEIEVSVSPIDVVNSAPARVPLDWWSEQYVLGKLKAAGAPVSGHVQMSLEAGTLTRIENYADHSIRFRWTDQ